MTTEVTIVPDTESQMRWRNWLARGAEGDRRTAKRIRGMALFSATVFVAWLVLQFA